MTVVSCQPLIQTKRPFGLGMNDVDRLVPCTAHKNVLCYMIIRLFRYLLY